ncbi:MAG TPA: DUF2760 domain-containing protein [Polyangiales bacterium]|nr:DUF2760 domain-containing protein [Polyangiales bacterium]
MSSSDPSFFVRLALAFRVFFLVLFNALFAKRVQQLGPGQDAEPTEPEQPAEPSKPATPSVPAAHLRELSGESALQLLGLLQREGRLVDFLQEDIGGYSDAQIGAAARVVHDQCRKALLEHVTLERIRTETEGQRITLRPGFSASEVRVVGQVAGEPPFTGSLTHAGWRAAKIELPKLSDGHDVHVIAPAEVEL